MSKLNICIIGLGLIGASLGLAIKKHLQNDVYIIGSDQVWRKAYINDKHYKSYFLDFVADSEIKKIAYAASFGKDYWVDNTVKKFGLEQTLRRVGRPKNSG